MTNTQITISVMVLIAIYLYWRYQPTKTIPHHPDDIIERKGNQKEVFFDAEDFDLVSEENKHD